MLKISVITTIYNGSNFIEKGINSILEPTLTDFEYIIVDDGSVDDSWDKICDFASKDNRIKPFKGSRQGRANALNFAIKKTTTDLIANFDIDDINYPNRLQHQYDFLIANPKVGWSSGNYIFNNLIRQERYEKNVPKKHQDILSAMCYYIPWAHTFVAFRKEAFEQVSGYSTVKIGVDLLIATKIAKAGWELENIEYVLGEHIAHPQSYWASHFLQQERMLEIKKLNKAVIHEFKFSKVRIFLLEGRKIYAYLPVIIQKIIRRLIFRSKEKDIFY